MSLIAAAVIGAAATGLGAILSNAINYQTAQDNIKYQREANNQNIAFQQSENAITRQREDTAVQRAASDMEAAGLSKTLAAGNPASAAALTAPKTQAVNNSFKYESALQKMNFANLMLDMAAKQQQLEINKDVADAQVNYYNEQADNIAANTVGQNISNDNAQRAADDAHLVAESQVALNESTKLVNSYKAELTKLESDNFVRKLDAEISNIMSVTNLNHASVGKVNNEVLEIIKRTEYLGSQIEHMDADTKLLVQKYVAEKINQFIALHNIGYAVQTGLPVGQIPSGLVGGITSSGQALVNSGSSALGNIPSYDTNAWQEQFLDYINAR